MTLGVKEGPGRDDPPRMARKPEPDGVDDAELVDDAEVVDDGDGKKRRRAPRPVGLGTVLRPAFIGLVLLAVADVALPKA